MTKNFGIVATLWARYASIVEEPCAGMPLAIAGKFEDMDFTRIGEIEAEINRRVSEHVPFHDSQGLQHVIENPVTTEMVQAVNDTIAKEYADVLLMVTLAPRELDRVLRHQ